MNTSSFNVYFFKKVIKKALFFLDRSAFREYHHFPFDTLAPMPKGSINNLQSLLSDFQKIEKGVLRISDGTLLGLARDGDLIPHDTDLDFDVFDIPDAVIREFAHKHDWVLGREVIFRGEVQQLTYYTYDQLIIDFVFWAKNGKFAINYSERDYLRVQPIEFFTQIEIVDFGALKTIAPSDLQSWLEYRYGKSWCMPVQEKSDWKTECGDLIYIGSVKS